MTSGLLLLAAMLAALTPNARKGDPCAAESWRAAPAQYEGKPVKTAVLGVEAPGLVTSDAPAAAVRILTGNEKEEAGGAIIVLLPLEKFQAFVANFSSRQLGANRSGFGALSKAKVVAATSRARPAPACAAAPQRHRGPREPTRDSPSASDRGSTASVRWEPRCSRP